jgi:hypothetical protein
MFGIPLAAAIYYRKRLDWHKRLMLSATLGLLGAPVLRLVLLTTELRSPIAWGSVISDLFFLPCIVYDIFTRGSVHRAYVYSLTLIVVSEIIMVQILSWPPWLALAQAIQHIVA